MLQFKCKLKDSMGTLNSKGEVLTPIGSKVITARKIGVPSWAQTLGPTVLIFSPVGHKFWRCGKKVGQFCPTFSTCWALFFPTWVKNLPCMYDFKIVDSSTLNL